MLYQNSFQQLEPPSQKFLSCHAYSGDADSSFTKHCHSFYEISFILKGSRYETLNQNKYKVEAGSLIFIPPLAIHGLNNITKVEDVVIQFDHLFIRNSSVLFKNRFMLKPAKGRETGVKIMKSDKLYKLFLAIRGYCRRRDCLSDDGELPQAERLSIDFTLNSLCLEILTLLIKKNIINVDANGAAYTDIKGINALINDLLSDPKKTVPMQEASRIAGMSYSHFSRFFRNVMGFNYVNFCNLLRIRHAEELLLTTDMPIYEITETVGLGTIAYFTKLFKQINGNIPSSYRKKYRM